MCAVNWIAGAPEERLNLPSSYDADEHIVVKTVFGPAAFDNCVFISASLLKREDCAMAYAGLIADGVTFDEINQDGMGLTLTAEQVEIWPMKIGLSYGYNFGTD
jgi:hypothetical protein